MPRALLTAAARTQFVTTRSRAFEKQLVDLSRYPFSGGALTAHLHTDPASGEAVGVSYPSLGEPSVLIHTFPPGGAPPTVAPVKLQGELQSMVHDCALTSAEGSAHGGYAVILDLPMTVRPERMLRDEFPVNYEQGGAARVGLWPRRGGGDEARWFDIEPCVVLHTFNAHQARAPRPPCCSPSPSPAGPLPRCREQRLTSAADRTATRLCSRRRAPFRRAAAPSSRFRSRRNAWPALLSPPPTHPPWY